VAALPVFCTATNVVQLDGDLDIFCRARTQAKLDTLGDTAFAIVDLRGATAVDAAFLGQLAVLRKVNAQKGGTIVLVVTNPAIRKLLHVVGFDRAFRIVESIEEAHAIGS